MGSDARTLFHHVPKDSLRPGSAVRADPPWPSFDVVHRSDYSALRDALSRYGHHDSGCSSGDVYDPGVDCPCGFNDALTAALGGYPQPPPKTTRRLDV